MSAALNVLAAIPTVHGSGVNTDQLLAFAAIFVPTMMTVAGVTWRALRSRQRVEDERQRLAEVRNQRIDEVVLGVRDVDGNLLRPGISDRLDHIREANSAEHTIVTDQVAALAVKVDSLEQRAAEGTRIAIEERDKDRSVIVSTAVKVDALINSLSTGEQP